jgi:hypothetical protein
LKIEAYTISLFDFPRDRVISDSPIPVDNFYFLLNDGYPDLSGTQALMHRRAVDILDSHACIRDGLKVAWLATDLGMSFSIVYMD